MVVQYLERLIQIKILDRNDNSPQLISEKNITVNLKDPHFRQVSKYILFFEKILNGSQMTDYFHL